uniref:Uncharacterized protein n=1 Tax=Rhinopithecus roxellana TaxID=61622 RepID=A0A2K6QG24_RHIRO
MLCYIFPTGSYPAFRVAPCDFPSTGLACIHESSLSCHFTGKTRRAGVAVKTWKRRT